MVGLVEGEKGERIDDRVDVRQLDGGDRGGELVLGDRRQLCLQPLRQIDAHRLDRLRLRVGGRILPLCTAAEELAPPGRGALAEE